MSEPAQSDVERVALADFVPAAIETIMTGMPVSRPGDMSCTRCHRELREGHQLTCYAYMADGGDWSLGEIVCGQCDAPRQLEEPTLGMWETTFEARLGTRSIAHRQQHRLVLVDVDVIAQAGPSEC